MIQFLTSISLYQLPNYVTKHQVRSDCKRSGVSIYIHKSLTVEIRNHLSVNNKDTESFSVEILSPQKSNTLFEVLHQFDHQMVKLSHLKSF